MKLKTLYVLTGPTAVGKTELALKWAQMHSAEILSCDSLLFYKGMDIGTAKPSSNERKKIIHHGIDLVPAWQQFTIYDYLKYARQVIESIFQNKKKILITGGSGFYLKAFFEPVVDFIPIPLPIQEKVTRLYKEEGLYGLLEALKNYNSQKDLESLDINNPKRVIKALARCATTKRSIRELKRDFLNQPKPFSDYTKKVALLRRSKETLLERIQLRTEWMLKNGLIEEVKNLLELGIKKNPSAYLAIGYRETLEWISTKQYEKDPLKNNLKNTIINNTLKLVAKQNKWFRNQLTPNQVFNLDEINTENCLQDLFTI